MYKIVTLDANAWRQLRELSGVLAGNKNFLPVAYAVAALDSGTPIKQPDITRQLGGELTPQDVTKQLGRLTELGVLCELPYAGKPHPRLWEREASAFWPFIEAFVAERL